MLRMMRVVAASMALGGPWLAATADAQNDEQHLGTVVVTATRTEQPIEQATTSISVISADDIASRHADSVLDVLRDVPGVDVSQSGSSGSTTSVFIRGADADQTLVLVDGVEVNSPTLGDFDFGTLNTDNLERIEVLRGAGGTLYGSEAVGGVINFLTKRGEGPPQFTLLNEGGNGDTQRHAMSFSGAQGPVGVTGSVSYLSTGGFRPVNDDFTLLASSLRADADLLEHGTLRGFFRYQDSVLGLFNNLNFISKPDADARDSSERYLFKGEWEHRPFGNFSYKVAGSVVHDTETFTDPDAASTSAFSVWSRVPTQITTGEAQTNYYAGGVGISTAGFEFKEKAARPKSLNVNFAPPPPLIGENFAASRSVFSGYFQQQLLLLEDRLIGNGGVRVDSDEDFGREVSASWSFGYTQDWTKDGRWSTQVKGSYAEGFKAPTFNELFFPNFGNPKLDAETSSEYNGGVVQRLWSEQLSVDGTYFNRRTKNLIQAAAMCPGEVVPAGTLVACNVGRADVQGVETGLTLGPFSGLSLRGSYTYLDFDVAGPPGSPDTLLRRPHNRMQTTVRYRRERVLRGDDEIDINAAVDFVGRRKDLEPTTFATVDHGSYTIAGLGLTYARPLASVLVKRLALFVRVLNLSDENYDEVLGFKSPPVHFIAGTNLTF